MLVSNINRYWVEKIVSGITALKQGRLPLSLPLRLPFRFYRPSDQFTTRIWLLDHCGELRPYLIKSYKSIGRAIKDICAVSNGQPPYFQAMPRRSTLVVNDERWVSCDTDTHLTSKDSAMIDFAERERFALRLWPLVFYRESKRRNRSDGYFLLKGCAKHKRVCDKIGMDECFVLMRFGKERYDPECRYECELWCESPRGLYVTRPRPSSS